jgi:hypothetical protein
MRDIHALARIAVDPVCGHVMLPLRPDPRRPFTRRSLHAAFALRSGFRLARSPSLPIATLHAFHAERRLALLWIRLPPIDFCNCNIVLPTRGHAHEHPILAPRLEDPHVDGPPSSPSIPKPFYRPRASPHEKAFESLRAATALPTTSPRRCKHAVRYVPGSHRPASTSLAGDAQAQPSLATTAVGRQRWTARAKEPRAKDLPLPLTAAAASVGEGSPPLFFRLLEHP